MGLITTDSEELLLRLFGGCQCSDDLAVVCEAHASLSWYAFWLLEMGLGPTISGPTERAGCDPSVAEPTDSV